MSVDPGNFHWHFDKDDDKEVDNISGFPSRRSKWEPLKGIKGQENK